MRLAVCLLATLSLASTAAAQATAPASSQPHRTVFSIQPLPDLGNDEDHRGPRLELERAVSPRLTVVLGIPARFLLPRVREDLDAASNSHPG